MAAEKAAVQQAEEEVAAAKKAAKEAADAAAEKEAAEAAEACSAARMKAMQMFTAAGATPLKLLIPNDESRASRMARRRQLSGRAREEKRNTPRGGQDESPFGLPSAK